MKFRERYRIHIQTAIIAMVVAAVTAAVPATAAIIADFARNSHKVDGIHAVKATATSAKRAKKLVATKSNGKLPNDIIAKAPDADTLDGLDSAALKSTGIAGYKNSIDNLNSTGLTNVATLDAAAGSYAIFAKAYLEDPDLTVKMHCRLVAEADFDETRFLVSAVGGSAVAMSLNVAHTFAAPGKIFVQCQTFGAIIDVRYIKITAIKLDFLTNTPLP